VIELIINYFYKIIILIPFINGIVARHPIPPPNIAIAKGILLPNFLRM